MTYPYTSPHDHPLFGPDPRDEIPQHCCGEDSEIDHTQDEDDQEYCSEDEYCTCSCEGCKASVKRIVDYDDGPEYDKYADEDRDYDYGWD